MEEQETLLNYLKRNKSQASEQTSQENPDQAYSSQAYSSDPGPNKSQGEDQSGGTDANAPPLEKTFTSDNPDPILEQAVTVHSLDQWREICLACTRCGLRAGANGVVFGEGDPRARIMFIGEGPGAEEDRQGRPFVGAAGRLLDRIIDSAGLSREGVYIANIVKCRPPKNRTPQKEEMETCLPLLEKQIELIDPPILVLLGSVAAKTLIDPGLTITRARGRWHSWGERQVMPTFHPAALLRDPGKKRPVWEDIKKVMARYEELGMKEP